MPFPHDPQSFNRYAYVRNRPLFATDPGGHQEALPTIHYSRILDKSCEAWNFFAKDKDAVASITTRNWAKVSI